MVGIISLGLTMVSVVLGAVNLSLLLGLAKKQPEAPPVEEEEDRRRREQMMDQGVENIMAFSVQGKTGFDVEV